MQSTVCRFATSSVPTASETHPHQWTPFCPHSAWHPSSQAPSSAIHALQKAAQHDPQFDSKQSTDGIAAWSPSTPADKTSDSAVQQAKLPSRWRLQPASFVHGIFVTVMSLLAPNRMLSKQSLIKTDSQRHDSSERSKFCKGPLVCLILVPDVMVYLGSRDC